MVVDVGRDVVAERRDRFMQPPAAVRFLFGGRQLVVDGCQQQHRQRGDEHERVKREFAEMAPRGRPLVQPRCVARNR